jgi:hypothetical protein
MKKLIPLSAMPAAILAAAPAMAHPGAHLHPHGIGEGTLLLAASLFVGGVAAIVIGIRK